MRRILVPVLVGLLIAASVPPAAAEDRVRIVRDTYGVPHVFAQSPEGLFYGMGYVAADDRLWQAETLRRAATGTLAELLGPSAVASDLEARLVFGPPERRAQELAQASPELQTMIESYVAGINARIGEESTAGTLPVEFGALGLTPRPWTADDVVAVFLLIGSRFGWFGADELTNFATWQALELRFGADAALVFGDLFWLDDPDAPTTAPGERPDRGRRPTGAPVGVPAGAEALAARLEAREEAVDRVREQVGIPAEQFASNALVISPRLSAHRSALLLGGPQMGYSTPQINHEVGLHGAGFQVTGMTIAGLPLVPIGVGDGLSWTLTSGGSDNTDIYVEALNPDDPTQYLFRGQWLDLDCRVEEVAVAGSDPVTGTLCSSVHGPILAVEGNAAFSLKNVTVGRELDSLEAWIGLGRASDIRQFAAALDEVAYNFNVLYADQEGNIAYWHIGHIPIRPDGFNPFFPLPGTGEAEWEGILPFDEMPRAVNPRQGYLTSWNNKPEPGWENSSADFWLWGGAHRVNTLIDELEELGPRWASTATVGEINRIGGFTTDTPTGTAGAVFVTSHLDRMLKAVDPGADPRLPEVVSALRGWDRLQVDEDGDGLYDDPYGGIFNAWWFALARSVFDEVYDLSNRFVVGNLVDRILRGDDAGLPLQYDYLEGVPVEEAVTAALVAALDELTTRFGSADPADWRFPIAVIVWEPIGAGSVPDTIWMNRGTYNQIVSLGDTVRAENVVAPGQSGEPASPHFADQLELYATWEYKPMRLTRADLRGHTESVVTLTLP